MNFKNIYLFLLSIFLLSSNLFAITNKTFLIPNTKGQEIIITESQTQNFIRDIIKEKNNQNFFLSNSWFYEDSCSAGGLSQYFMPNGKTELLVQGAGVATAGVTDIYAEWLGIPSSGDMDAVNAHTFSSRISISPEIKRWGTNFYVYKKLRNKFWFSMLVPFANVATNANLNESQITGARPESLVPAAGGGIGVLFYEEPLNVIQALSHPLMKYGKIDNIKHQKSGIADINLKLGINKIYDNKYILDIYTQGIIPTADKPTAEYLFEPIVGNGHHFGVGAGLKFSTNYKNLTFLSNFDYLYLFSGTEKRSLDLYNCPWSRYMAATLGLPRTRPERLINYLTQDLKVVPCSQFNALFAFNWKKDKFHLEFGTNIESKSNERVSLKGGWNESVAIAHYADGNPQDLITGATWNGSYSNATINNTMVTDSVDAIYTPISLNKINLDSAKNLNSLSLNPYFNLGFDGKFLDNQFNLSSGLFYKVNSNNKSIGSVGIWLNFSIQL